MNRNRLTRIGFIAGVLSSLAFLSASAENSANSRSDITVKATRAETALKDLGFSASVVTSEDIKEMNADNVADALREVPGLRVTQYGSSGALSEISVRGSSTAQVLVLVDGRRINKTSDGSVDFSSYKASDIERIEIIRGPASMLHGANALAGVVNIITKGIDEEPFTSLTAEIGTFNTQFYDLTTSRKFGDLGLRLSVGHRTSDGDRENSQSDGNHVTARLEHDSENGHSVFSAGLTTLDTGLPGSTKYPSPRASQDEERSWFDVTHHHSLSDSVEIEALAFINDAALDYADPDLSDENTIENRQYGADIQASVKAGKNHNVVAGIYVERGEVDVRRDDGSSKIDGRQTLDSHALFVQDVIQVTDDLTLTPGVRYDDYYELDTEVSPKISARYYASDNTSLKASYGRGFRPPTVNDLYWQSPFAVGNPDLEAEKSEGWDAGIEQAFGDSTLASLSYFSMTIDDLLTWEPRESDGLWSPFNISEAEIRGLELEVSSQLSQSLTLSIAYTWMETEDKGDFSGKELTYKPEHRASGRLSYKGNNGLAATVALAYTDSVYSDQSNTEKLDSYLLLDARVAKTLCGNCDVFISGRNLLDEEYSVINGYPLPGTTFNGGIEVTF